MNPTVLLFVIVVVLVILPYRSVDGWLFRSALEPR
jgi:hypothetical protein